MFSLGLLSCTLSSYCLLDVYALLSCYIQVRYSRGYSITRVHNLLWTLVIIIDIILRYI